MDFVRPAPGRRQSASRPPDCSRPIEGLPWDRRFWTYSLGGHCVPLSAYRQGDWDAQTWGQDQVVMEDYIETEADELYAVVDPDWLDVAGKSPTGLDLAGLLAASAKFAAANAA